MRKKLQQWTGKGVSVEARIIITKEMSHDMSWDEFAVNERGEPFVLRKVRNAKKVGPYWQGEASILGKWHKVTAGATISGNQPTEWDLVEVQDDSDDTDDDE